ncbi:MAG: sigma-70 family RNA polymerase sigma factor [Oscillospiraceae bacterium]|nr:sigma-70 family RNA polymerase sigma factor [Oscillospiraceae bacterium]
MTNEELVLEIQAGRTELFAELWENVRGFVAYLAARRMMYVQDVAAVEIDDLIQAGFLGLVAAVKAFDPEAGSFLACLKLHLKRAFNNACGVGWERVARDPIHTAQSLDAPINPDDPEGAAQGDFIRDQVDFSDYVIEKIYREQLREQLEKLLSRLSPKAADVIRATFLDGETSAKIAERYGMTVKNLASSRNGYLTQLRVAALSTPEGAQLRRFIEDNTNYYLQVNPDQFHRRHTSAVEALAMRREDLEKIWKRAERYV